MPSLEIKQTIVKNRHIYVKGTRIFKSIFCWLKLKLKRKTEFYKNTCKICSIFYKLVVGGRSMSNSAITPWVIGNWKMNPMHASAFQLIEEFKQLLQQDNISPEQCHIGVAPMMIALTGPPSQPT